MPEQPAAVSTNFPTPYAGDWLALVEKTLKGKPFAKAMVSHSADGIAFDALTARNTAVIKPQPTRHDQNWLVTSPHWGSDATAVNVDILEDLLRGASAIALTIDTGSQGIAPNMLGAALEGVYLDMVPLTLIQGENFEPAIDELNALVADRNYAQGTLSGCLGVDPIGHFARTGRLTVKAEDLCTQGASIAKNWSQQHHDMATFNADGTVVANAGASEAAEVGAALSSAVQYLRCMEAQGLSVEAAATQIQFTLSADTNLWLTIAKFRAARRVWQGILAACGVTGVPMKLNAVSAVYQFTMYDPWVNILRGTAECFAAAIGGADIITTLPHDLMLGTTSSFSRRIARNIQIVLMEESNLGRVADPAAGSFALETLTAKMTEKIAEQFKSIEAQGGILSSLRRGSLAKEIEAIAGEQANLVRTRKHPITGVSEFPDITEGGPSFSPGPMPEDAELPPAVDTAKPLLMRRAAVPFETLRMRSDAIKAATGSRPRVALINIGAPVDFTARATFAKNFFEAGGIEAVPGSGIDGATAAANQFADSDAELAIICGRDEQYADVADAIANALKEKGCWQVFLAGSAKIVSGLTHIDDYVSLGCDAVTILEAAYSILDRGTTGGNT